MQKVEDFHEVVPIHFNEIDVAPEMPSQTLSTCAVRLNFHGVMMEIDNSADATVIMATLKALHHLC